MDNTDFFNLYVKNLVNEVTELTKSKILLATQNGYKDAEIEELKKKVVDLEAAAAAEKDTTTKAWKATIEEKDSEITKSQQEMVDLRRQLQAKQNNLASLNARIEELYRDQKDKEAIIANLNEQLQRMTDFGKRLNIPKKTRKNKQNANIVLK